MRVAVLKGGRLVAMMAVHQSTPRDWTQREISLVADVVERCWAHIERVRDAAMLREHPAQITYLIYALYSMVCQIIALKRIMRLYREQISHEKEKIP